MSARVRSCYNCAHSPVCKFRDGVQAAVTHNIGMVDTDQPSSSPKSFIRIFETIAIVCKLFRESSDE